jgi:hypothetical protein
VKEDILKLRSEGKSYSQIQTTLGCSKGTISYHCGEGQKQKTSARIKKRRAIPGIRVAEYDKYRIKSIAYSKKSRELLNKSYVVDLLRDCKVKSSIEKHKKKVLKKRIIKVIKRIDEK